MAPASPGMLNTPKQMLMQEVGGVPKFAEGGQPSPEQMQAFLIANNQTPPRFKFAEGGSVQAQFSREEFSALHPLFVALGLIDPDDHIKYNK